MAPMGYLAHANILQCTYNKAQSLLGSRYSIILGLVASNQFCLIFFFYYFIFNYRVITLQYCGLFFFFSIHQHEMAIGIQMSPPLEPPPTSIPSLIPLPSL